MDKTAIELSKRTYIDTINTLRNEIDGYRPISNEIENKVFQKLKLDWNYNSNAIEGNKLNYGETVAFLMHGITAKGKTLKDHLDIKGHNEAINFLLSLIKEERDISESDIRALHKMVLVEEYDTDAISQDGNPTKKRIKLGAYKTTPNSVKTRTGEMHYYATPEETPLLMADLMNWYNENKINNEVHPLVLASLFHFKFVAIHPFDDGNGRLARILMNLILMRNQYPPIVVKNEDKQNYYGVLSQADNNQFIPLIEYMTDLLQHSLTLYLKGIKGESIEEESDIDKEIALLKKSLDSKVLEKKGKSTEILEFRLKDSIIPFVKCLEQAEKKFEVLFYLNMSSFNYTIIDFNENEDVIETEMTTNSLEEFVKNIVNNVSMQYGYTIHLMNYKDKFNFKVVKKIFFDFNDFSYLIYTDANNIQKNYNEKISQEEINIFVNAIMKDILQEIKQATNLKS